jgi:hypothetical protein
MTICVLLCGLHIVMLKLRLNDDWQVLGFILIVFECLTFIVIIFILLAFLAQGPSSLLRHAHIQARLLLLIPCL